MTVDLKIYGEGDGQWIFACPLDLYRDVLQKRGVVVIPRQLREKPVYAITERDKLAHDIDQVEFHLYRAEDGQVLGVKFKCFGSMPTFAGLGSYVFRRDSVLISEDGILYGSRFLRFKDYPTRD